MSKSSPQLVPALTMYMITGCGQPFTALPTDGQVPIGDHRGILEKRAGVAVLVRAQSIPWDHGGRFIAFNVEVTNFRAEPLAIGPGRSQLIDEEGVARRAIEPVVLERAFESALSDAAKGIPAHLRHAVASRYRCGARYARTFYHRHRSYRRHYDCEPYCGTSWYFGWGPYYDDYYDGLYRQQLMRERIAQSLAELLRQRELGSDETKSGHLFFSYDPQKDETVTVRLELDPPGRAEREPTPEPAEAVPFEFSFLCSR